MTNDNRKDQSVTESDRIPAPESADDANTAAGGGAADCSETGNREAEGTLTECTVAECPAAGCDTTENTSGEETVPDGQTNKNKCLCGEPDNAEKEDAVFSGDVFGKLYELIGQFPACDVPRDVASKAFRLFAAGKRGDVADIYGDYLAFRKAAEGEAGTAEKHTEPSAESAGEDVSPRGYSGFTGGTAAPDYGAGLTARQMQIARSSGMSCREYAELLNSIPSRKKTGI